jgi:hypothetical protein
MSDQLRALLQPAGLKTFLFPPSSRYHGVDVATTADADGKTIAYLRRRFVPPPERFALLQEHIVTQGDRLDNLTARYLGDPEQFWQVCDANNAMHPDDLTAEIGRHLRITLPEGIPGT